MSKFYTSVILPINQSKEIGVKQFSCFCSRGGQKSHLMHIPLSSEASLGWGKIVSMTRKYHNYKLQTYLHTTRKCHTTTMRHQGNKANGENLVSTLAPPFLIGSSSFLQVTRTTIKSRIGSKFGKIQPGLWSKLPLSIWNNPQTYNGRNVVSSLVPSLLHGFLSLLQVTRITIIEFLPDPITNYYVSCSCAFEKSMYIVVITKAPSFLT